jgi:hypothetical protein
MNINEEIEILREKLHKMLSVCNELCNAEIVKVSEQLDSLIEKYYLEIHVK